MPRKSERLYFRGIPIHFSLAVPENSRGTGPVQHALIISSPLVPLRLWQRIEDELVANRCLAVTVELPGFAGSYQPGDIPTDPALLATMLWGLLDSVDARYKTPLSMWHIISHGTSGNIALQMVRQSPGSVSSQVYISPVFALELPQNIVRMREIYSSAVSTRSAFARFLSYYIKNSEPLDRETIDAMHGELSRRGSMDTFIRTLRQAQVTRLRGMDFGPTMMIFGRLDPLCTEQALREADRLLPGCEKHALGNCGHYPMITHNKATCDFLRGWLRFIERGH